MGTIVEHFDTLSELVAACERDRPIWDRSSRATTDTAWRGSATFEEATEQARYGWPEGRQRMAHALEHAQAIVTREPAPEWRLDVAGAFPHVPAAVAGEPEAMWHPDPQAETNRPIARLLVNRGTLQSVRPAQIINYGAALLAHIDRLESAGTRCEVICATSARAGNADHTLTVIAKHAQEPLDLDRLAFCLASPAFHRRLVFARREAFPELSDMQGSYGSTRATLPASIRHEPGLLNMSGPQAAGSNCDSPRAATVFLRERIAAEIERAGL